MKIILIIQFILINLLMCQSSSLTLYGIGERSSLHDASAASMGDLKLFSSNSIDFVLYSPSSYCNNKQTNLSMSTVFSTLKTDYIDKLSSNNFSHLSFGFPITNKQYFLLSFNPYMRNKIHIEENSYKFIGANNSNQDIDNDGNDDPLAYKNKYGINGGISEASLSFSTIINQNISLGLKFGKLFGTTEVQDTLDFYSAHFNQDGSLRDPLLLGWPSEISSNTYNYSSSSYMIDMRFKLDDNYLAIYYGQTDNLLVDIYRRNYSPTQSATIIYNEIFDNVSLKGSKEYGVGIKCNVNSFFSYVVELHKFNSFSSSKINQYSLPSLNMKSFHIGGIYRLKDELKGLQVNFININFGLYHKLYKSNNQFNQIPLISDFGLSTGFEIEYLNNNSFSVALQIGKRFTELYEFKNELYYKLILSLKSNNKWFVKERE